MGVSLVLQVRRTDRQTSIVIYRAASMAKNAKNILFFQLLKYLYVHINIYIF